MSSNFIIYILIIFLSVEIIIISLVLWLKKDFQWLIISTDENITIPTSNIKKFIKENYDEKLGWDRKPNISKLEKVIGFGEYNKLADTTEYNINLDSERYNPGHENLDKKIITYGDSYTFCRHVNDNETWQWFLSEHTKTNVVNRGVGNYGLDQACLKMSNTITEYEDSAETVIMTVVPETIVRIVNVWKHFYEHGNILGFKGRYFYNDKVLSWSDCIAKEVFIDGNKEWRKKVKKLDFCYEAKFKKDAIRFPFTLSLLMNYERNAKLIYFLFKKQVIKIFGLKNKNHNEAWNHVMKCNHKFSTSLYENDEISNLLRAIVLQYAENSKGRGLKPIFVIIPYLEDMKSNKSGELCYSHILKKISKDLVTIDMGETFMKEKNINKLYVSDSIGAHLSKIGNKIVADKIKNTLGL